MFSYNNKISVRQLQMLLVLDIFGTGIITLPRRAAEYAGQDGWIVVIGATLLALAYAWIITSLGRMFPHESFVSYTGRVMSKPVGNIICFILAVKILLNTALELRFFGDIVRQVLLRKTPFAVVCGAMLLVAAYAAAMGYETRARIAEILFFVVIIPLTFVFCVGLSDVDFTNLQPFFRMPAENIAMGSLKAGFAFNGLELLLLVHPYITRPKDVRKGSLAAVAFIGVFMLFITVSSIAKFGPEDLKRHMWPVLEMMDSVNLPGSFIERQDAIIMSFWIISVFAIINAGLFFSSLILKDLGKKDKSGGYPAVCALIAFVIACMPENITGAGRILDSLSAVLGVAYMMVIPLLLLIIAGIRRRTDGYEK